MSDAALRVMVQHRFADSDAPFALDVDFSIERWPAVLFGPSGAGKTTLLRMIAGMDRADRAAITFGGQAIGFGGRSGVVQMVSQRPALFPYLSVAQNVAFGLAGRPRAERRARVEEVLRLLGAEELADRKPQRLSGGERQRVAIARALAPTPKLLLLDEAFAGLDTNAKRQILTQLSAVLDQCRIAALHVTHEVEDAFALNAEVVVVQSGRVVIQGPVDQALAAERKHLLSVLTGSASKPDNFASHLRSSGM